MNACNRLRSSVLATTILAALAATACTAVSSDDKGDPNVRVDKVVVVGTSVTSALYTTGDLGLTTIPQDAASDPVLDSRSVEILVSMASVLSAYVGISLDLPEPVPRPSSLIPCPVPE